jgi:large subunit ribosomal protein L2
LIDCGCRTSKVALVGVKEELKYILATENMKVGDIIKTSKFIPRNPVRANEGDAYPLGALPIGTMVHNVEKFPDSGNFMVHAAGCFASIIRKFDDRVVLMMPNKREFAFLQNCMATVGRLSNVEHKDTHIGSATRLRELGYRPRSGLWQRKTGRSGRKIKKPPPMKLQGPSERNKVESFHLTLREFDRIFRPANTFKRIKREREQNRF